MPIDYSKQPGQDLSGAPAAPAGPVRLTKSAPSVSLTKHSAGVLRVNLNWNARPTASHGFLHKSAPSLDLDLGCLYEFADGTKGVVQALGNSFSAPRGANPPVIRLDGDDRSGTVEGGENLFIDLGRLDHIRRVLVFALIYEGAANWAAADGVATLFPTNGAPITIALDDPRDGARICAVAMLTNSGSELVVHREVNYLNGAQRALDEAYGWGIRWTAGHK